MAADLAASRWRHPPPTPGDASAGRFRPELLVAGIVFVIAFSTIRFHTGTYGSVEQWINMTNRMFQGKQDFLFSYGPLYWIVGGASSPYNAFTYWTAVTFLSAFYAFFWGMLAALVQRARGWLFFALAFVLFYGSVVFLPAQWLWPLALVLLFELAERDGRRAPPWAWVLFGAGVALAFYVRFFYGLLAVVTVACWFAPRFLLRRDWREPLPFLGGLLAGYLAFGLLIFHDAASLLDYVVINSQLNFGNSVDMTLGVREYARAYLAVFVLFVLLNIYLVLREPRLLLLVDALFLLFFKMGFGRSDHMAGYFVLSVAVLALVLLLDRSRLGRGLFLACTAFLLYLQVVPIFSGAPTRNNLKPSMNFDVPYEQRLQELYAAYRLDEATLKLIGDATVDVYPYHNEYAFANRLNYLQRPLFQNYMTLTPKLDAMNARFFASPGRPRFVLWSGGIGCVSAGCNPFEGFDEKYALNEDPLTSAAILRNYRVVRVAGGRQQQPVLVLQENEAYTPYEAPKLGEQTMRFGEWYKVPESADGVVKLVPQLRFTLTGRLQNLLFRGSVVRIKYRFGSGEVREFRINVLNSGSGLWVSPWLDRPDLSGERVTAVMLESRGWNYLHPEFQASWVKLDIPALRTRLPSFDPLLDQVPGVTGQALAACEGSIDSLNGQPPAPARVDNAGALRVQGWLAHSTREGVLADAVFVTLRDAAGQQVYAATHALERRDVADVFGKPALAAAGFETLVDTTALKPGSFTLGLAGLRQGRLLHCSQFAFPLTIAPQ